MQRMGKLKKNQLIHSSPNYGPNSKHLIRLSLIIDKNKFGSDTDYYYDNGKWIYMMATISTTCLLFINDDTLLQTRSIGPKVENRLRYKLEVNNGPHVLNIDENNVVLCTL